MQRIICFLVIVSMAANCWALDLNAGQASADSVIDLSSTLEERLNRMQPGYSEPLAASGKNCQFVSRFDLEIILQTLEAAMASSERADVQQAVEIVHGYRVERLWVDCEFDKPKSGRYRFGFIACEGSGYFQIWLAAKGNQLTITSFVVVNPFD